MCEFEFREVTEDYLALHPSDRIKVHDDGFVRLVDMMPRHVPIGRTPDFAIIRNARISLGEGTADLTRDLGTLRYLYLNQHTTPFESVIFTFHLRLPRFVATHLIRHRTASINEFSQRYAEVDDCKFFHPSLVPGSLRGQSGINKQASVDAITDEKIVDKIKAMETKIEDLFVDYHELIRMGVGKEVARSFLPVSTYTEMYYTMNLHNLLHFFNLRCDKHAQKETRDYADAMYTIVKGLVPETMKLYEEITRDGMRLSGREIAAIQEKRENITGGKAEKEAFHQKIERLNIDTTL